MPVYNPSLHTGARVTQEHSPQDRIDYNVHLKYVTRLALLSKGLAATTRLKPKIDAKALDQLRPKMHLLDLTTKLLADEVHIVNEDADYALACVSWLPAKVYYCLYHLLSILEYMMTGDQRSLHIGHFPCLDSFAKKLRGKEISFSYPGFNETYDKSILIFKSRSGEILSESVSDELLLKLIMKKIVKDKLKDTAARQSINRRTGKGRKTFAKLQDSINISIVDFFYSMRIRTNYKDMAFIDGLDADSTRRYFLQYYEAANNFYTCFSELKNTVITNIDK